MDELEVSKALECIFDLLRSCNKYIDDTTPWVLAKDEEKKDRLKKVIYNLVESIRIATVQLQSFLPDTAESIFKQLNTDITDYGSIDSFGAYKSGTKVNKPEVLFMRVEK